MPTVKQPKREPKSHPSILNGSTEEVLTLPEAAAYLRLSESQVMESIRLHDLPARLLGSECRFLKSAIQDWLKTGPSAKSGKNAWLAIVGSCKDDPDLEGIVEEAYRKRGRPITEDGSFKNFSKVEK